MPAVRALPKPHHSALELSKVQLTQQEMLGQDFDIEKFNLIMDHKLGVRMGEAITSASVSRTIDGASTLTVTVLDPNRTLLRSGLHAKLDVQIDGLWWRLRQVNKQGDFVTLTFEDREVSILRGYKSFIPLISRSQITRAQFIVKMLNEVQEVTIPYYIPDLYKKQAIESQAGVPVFPPQGLAGLSSDNIKDMTVKHQPANPEQGANAHAILAAGDAAIANTNPHKRKIMVCAIMTAIQESSITNLPGGVALDGSDSKGVFQQRASQGWPASGDVVIDANAFFSAAISLDASDGTSNYNDLCQRVQNSGKPYAYGQWRTEAERWVSHYGAPGQDAIIQATFANQSAQYMGVEGSYHFYRGIPPSRKSASWLPESTWSCIQRLAIEVNWRAFFVSGLFCFISEDDLFKSKPVAEISEDSLGIDWIDGDYDRNKPTSSVTITCRMGRYDFTPGTVVKLFDQGTFDGRWLIETIERPLDSPLGTVSIKKPDPTLLEPFKDVLVSNVAFGGQVPLTPGTTPTTFASGTVPDMAKKILTYYDKGKYRDDNGHQIAQWRKVADGKMLHNQCGTDVHLAGAIAQIILSLLDEGWMIGTYAMCEDHSCQTTAGNQSQHPLGQGIDISSLGKPDVGWRSLNKHENVTTQWVKELMVHLRDFSPDQIICNGVGINDPSVAALQWNHGNQTNYITDDHTNHMHVGASGSDINHR